MAEYIRSIRGIERSNAYAPISAVNPYAAYRNRELIEPSRAEPVNGLADWEASSAKGAAAWLRTAKAAEGKLNSLIIELGRQEGWRNGEVTKDKLRELDDLLNGLASVYKRNEEYLMPEVWEVIELALRHPATSQFGLARGELSLEGIEERQKETFGAHSPALLSALEDPDKARRLLLGADGLLTGLKTAVAYAEKQQPADWLKLPFTAAYPYAMYYGAAQLYWPLPSRGSIVNKYI
ncbi:hypothetical protein B1748_21960 [Paenibacillus sp. MY03]|jgi:hypothetical protein|uniref:hypothetical protein n=1 Tax=Paenibacillus sp. MY03 TaxID=302980 RepID=UPI000B3C6822|nr:hypothetical protein [Paenibacillus sp. MY03]OUS74009.1 hypothetical protein B1748_21960 [Paenibacillus sp. MY03]